MLSQEGLLPGVTASSYAVCRQWCGDNSNAVLVLEGGRSPLLSWQSVRMVRVWEGLLEGPWEGLLLGWQLEYLLGEWPSLHLLPDQLCLLPSLWGNLALLVDGLEA